MNEIELALERNSRGFFEDFMNILSAKYYGNFF
jgi:hypothetical protein